MSDNTEKHKSAGDALHSNGNRTMTNLQQYVKQAIDAGFNAESLVAVRNPLTNHAINLADLMLAEAMRTSEAAVTGNVSIELEGQWQFLYVGDKPVSYDELVKGLEVVLERQFKEQLNISEAKNNARPLDSCTG